MRPAGAAFVCGEMNHERDPCSSHTLRRDQRAIQMHLMLAARPCRCRQTRWRGCMLANDAPLTQR